MMKSFLKYITNSKNESKPMDEKIEIGTVVQLKSGSFSMTVQDIAIVDKYTDNERLFKKGDYLCRWCTKDGQILEKWFASNSVTIKLSK